MFGFGEVVDRCSVLGPEKPEFRNRIAETVLVRPSVLRRIPAATIIIEYMFVFQQEQGGQRNHERLLLQRGAVRDRGHGCL